MTTHQILEPFGDVEQLGPVIEEDGTGRRVGVGSIGLECGPEVIAGFGEVVGHRSIVRGSVLICND